MHYLDYFWKMGKPYGKGKTNPTSDITYKIVSDPYYKRITVEKYQQGIFKKIIYDSIFLDFRHLRLPEHNAWQREIIGEEQQKTTCLLRNQDDRAILFETLHYELHHCRSCRISSIHGIEISTHKMFYQTLKDPFNGVILFDAENKPIMIKVYDTDPFTGEFNQLLSEEWNMESLPVHLKV